MKKRTRTTIPQTPLFRTLLKQYQLPELPVYPLDDAYDEVQLLGFPVCNPFMLADADPSNYLPAAEMKNHVGKVVTVLGYHITQKPVRTIRGETMSFGTFIDAQRGWIDTVHFPAIYKKLSPKAGFYRIAGIVIEEFGVCSLEVIDIEKVGIKQKRVTEALT
jgi:DNA polymerase-3 subunit alpha